MIQKVHQVNMGEDFTLEMEIGLFLRRSFRSASSYVVGHLLNLTNEISVERRRR
jgi:hypothetical protein